MSVLIRKTANAIRIMTASEVNIQWALGGAVWFNCLNSLLVLNSPLYLVLSPWISSAKAVCQFSGTVHVFHVDHHCLRFVCQYHMMHGPNVASWINQDCVSWLDKAWLDCIFGTTLLVYLDCSHWVDGPGVFSKLKNHLPGLGNFEFANCLDCFSIN